MIHFIAATVCLHCDYDNQELSETQHAVATVQ